MSLSNIENLTLNMTDPDKIIQAMNTATGNIWAEFFLYGLFFTITFALNNHLDKFSKRISIASTICFTLAVPLFAIDLLSKTALLRVLFVLVGSLVWLFIDTRQN